MKKILLFLLTILFVSSTASAYTYSGYTSPFNPTGTSSVTVNPDKTLNINGRTLFPQIMYTVCDVYSMTESQCFSNLNKMKNYTADMAGSGFGSKANRPYDPLPYYASTKVGVIPLAYYHYPVISPNLFGYHGRYDEPDISLYNKMKSDYDLIKSQDKNHIVITSVWHTGKNWETASDVIIFGSYIYRNLFINHPTPREKAQYNYEYMIKNNILIGYNNFDETKDPFWPIIQSLSGPDDAGALPTTKSESKALMYNAITMNVKGFAYWSYSFVGGTSGGLMNNQTKVDEHITLSDEINYLSDILVLPTKDYSWHYRKGNNVTFDKNFTYTLQGGEPSSPYNIYTEGNFNYMLKQNGSTYYLIVLNKDDRSISNVNITIRGLNGIMTATTLGLATAGSKPGRILPVINGTFTDSFAGLEPIVYEITSGGSNGGSTPEILSWGNTKTNNATLSFNIGIFEPITFNTSANQAITKWTWLKDDVQAGNTGSSYSTSWDSIGEKTIKVYGSNGNGSTSTTTWTITVNQINPSKFGVGGAAWDSAGTSSNVYIEDNRLKLGFWGENFDDGLYDWTTEEGNVVVVNKKLTMYGSANAHVSKIIGNHSNVAMFATWTETSYDGFKSFAIRSDTSRRSLDMNYWFSGRPTGNGLWIVKYGTDWVNINETGTFARTNGSTSFCVAKAYGNNLESYCSHDSYADALASLPVSHGTDSTFAYGNRIRLEGSFARNNDIVTFDNLRMIPTDSSGNLINSGSKTIYYDAGPNNQTSHVIFNTTTPANTNFTVSYRQKLTGAWIQIGNIYTGNQTIAIPGNRYQETEINITLSGNGSSFPEIESIEFITEHATNKKESPQHDVDENGIVDFNDLTLVSKHFNEIVSIPLSRFDVNKDGVVDILDISIVSKHIGEKS
ncbi:MAG: dockerin type I domain-containing protein [Candidatus Methanoperedens sp.]|nr:dockerin type I domain-containing protein [Candidatus Methanoperedens sp.]